MKNRRSLHFPTLITHTQVTARQASDAHQKPHFLFSIDLQIYKRSRMQEFAVHKQFCGYEFQIKLPDHESREFFNNARACR
jgi:hypothetical protein